MQQVGRRRVLIEAAGLVLLDPDPDKVAREIMPVGKPMKGPAGQVLMRGPVASNRCCGFGASPWAFFRKTRYEGRLQTGNPVRRQRPTPEIRASLRGGSPISTISAADHPDEPIYWQRQPARAGVPKAKSANCFPATYTDGATLLANWPRPEVILTCETCKRCETCSVTDLRQRFGLDMLVTNLRVELSAERPRGSQRRSTISVGRCWSCRSRTGRRAHEHARTAYSARS